MSDWLTERAQSTQGLLLDRKQKILAIHLGAGLGWIDLMKRFISEDQALIDSKLYHKGLTPLMRACVAGKREAAATLIDRKANVNLEGGSSGNPLIMSTIYRHKSLVELLLENGADPNRRDADGFTPLYWAAYAGDATVATALLERKTDPLATAPNVDDQTPLHIAAEKQSVEVIKIIHRVHPKLDMKTRQGMTALHTAASYNSSRSAEVLLELGAPKDEVDEDKRTAIFIAAQEGFLDTVKVLTEAKCDATLAAWNGRTAVHAAASSRKLSVLRCVMESQPFERWTALVNQRSADDETPIHAAIRSGNTEIVRYLLKAGSDATASGFLKSSPLHYAAHYGHNAISRLLLSHAKEANPRNKDCDTPLHFAARERKLDFIVQFFQDCSRSDLSVEIDAQNEAKKTALLVALDNGGQEVAEFLLEKGAVSKPDVDGSYPIHLAAWCGFDSIVENLLHHEGVTSQGCFGQTPFFCAAVRGQLKTLKLLAPRSSEIVNVGDKMGVTPVLAALINRNFEVANYLLDLGADYHAVDEYGNGLLHIAAGNGDLPMVQRLLDLGCNGETINKYGARPFHAAVRGGSIEVVDALVAAGFSAVDIPDNVGNSCRHIAAQEGHLEMLQKIDALGARREICDQLGGTPAYDAAEAGHWEILQYLKNNGENVDLPDLEGNTPLIAAAWSGYPETVEYLLQGQAHVVNDCNTWGRVSPLLAAASSAHPRTIECLLAAGADPYHRDATGLNALDYSARHPPSLRQMHKAGHFHDPDSLDVQHQILGDTIRDCCDKLLLVPQRPSEGELYYRLERLSTLSGAMIQMQDYNAAKFGFMELLWPPKIAQRRFNLYCAICQSKSFPWNKYVCKSCYELTFLCEECYQGYNDSGRRLPVALEECVELETQIQPVRVATSELSLVDVFYAMNYFSDGKAWLSEMLDKYEAWEQRYNSHSKYRELKRPGQ